MNKSFKDLLVGVLLGDAHIRRVGSNKAYFTFEQASQKSDYFNHVYDAVKAENLVKDLPSLYVRSDPRYGGRTTSSWHFKSETLEELRPFADLFLDEKGGKIIPSNISDLLTPRSLAFWIMDDGQQVKRGGVTLCTDSFKTEEISVLREVLKSNFDLKTSIHTKKGVANAYERIYISKDSAYENLKPSIAEHMQESMLYKINMGAGPDPISPVNTPSGIIAPTLITENSLNQSVDSDIEINSTLNLDELAEALLEVFK